MTSTRPSVAFTAQIPSKLGLKITRGTVKGVTRKGKLVRSNNRAVPLNPLAPKFKPRSGNFGTKRIIGG